MTLLAEVVRILDANAIRYALIGAGALAAHGVARSTYDIDLLTMDGGVLDAGLWLSISDATADIRTADAEDPLAGVVRFRRPDDRDVDLIVGRPTWQDGVLQRATPLQLPDVTVPVVTAPDLILLKLYAGGSQDAWDIEQLLAGSSRSALIREVEQRVSVLPPDGVSLWHELTRA